MLRLPVSNSRSQVQTGPAKTQGKWRKGWLLRLHLLILLGYPTPPRPDFPAKQPEEFTYGMGQTQRNWLRIVHGLLEERQWRWTGAWGTRSMSVLTVLQRSVFQRDRDLVRGRPCHLCDWKITFCCFVWVFFFFNSRIADPVQIKNPPTGVP